jgi:hypothetical protein
MPELLTAASKLKCPHGGTVKITSFSKAKAAGSPIATMKDLFTITGCPFQLPTVPAPTPSPCIVVMWLKPMMKVLVMGVPALDQASIGLCIAATGLPQGPPVIVRTQPKVKGL